MQSSTQHFLSRRKRAGRILSGLPAVFLVVDSLKL